MKRLNEWIAVRMTLAFGTMAAVYITLAWSLLPLVWPQSQIVVFYVSSGVIQLVALPAIMVGQMILGRKAEERAQQDHEAIMAQLADMQVRHAMQEQTLAEVRATHQTLLDVLAKQAGGGSGV